MLVAKQQAQLFKNDSASASANKNFRASIDGVKLTPAIAHESFSIVTQKSVYDVKLTPIKSRHNLSLCNDKKSFHEQIVVE